MIRNLSMILFAAALACASCQMEKEAKSPVDVAPKPIEDNPRPLPTKSVTADVSIASVSMVEDCPDEKPATKAEREPPQAKDAPGPRAKSMSAVQPMGAAPTSYGQPCQQSFMQVAIMGDSPFRFAIAEIRVLDSAGTKLGTVQTRMPTIWESEGYAAWDETVMPNFPVKASYKVSLPSWDDGRKRAVTDFGATYFLEADVLVDGVSKTVRSTLVSPEPAGIIQT